MTNKKDYDYSAFVGVGHNSENELSEVAQLAEAQYAAECKVEEIESALDKAKEELRVIAEKKLPEKMELLGLTTFSTSNGVHVKISEKIRASLAVENRPKGFDWLEKNGFGGMIKSQVIIPYKRDQLEEANEFVDGLRKGGKLANLERKVEPATLTAFVKEQLTKGEDLPLEVFGVFRQRIAKVEV